ncbi:PH domain protein [Ichthyophthirius multifiliis]|uniref:PH domain protein n=1 Tax=Ichthyophthirius multifiliis TaxID=5932 RepID=G0QML3_ICHMU|nr:PH domain protein [Ichthyophthirius multifiliis]EGR33546.1 PH domain protein [Ichthyophthirius multifiliis]|eukprot:XP_004037532.1 PH domain protein [Ichthyophthirius multifiliis]
MELIQKVGKQLIEGKDVVSVSLPVRIFEPRSTIERICDNWAFMPIYLRMAANTKDQLERFKLTISYAVAGLHNACKQMKPFNPILGETFQGFWPDGTSICIEHTSHHPPISHFYVEDQQKKFSYFGYYEYKARLKGANSVLGSQDGPNHVLFYDGQEIIFSYPPCKITGLLYGTRVLEWFDQMVFRDEKNDLECILSFEQPGGYFYKAQNPTDFFIGQIRKISDKNNIICEVKGSWLDYLMFDGKKYWDIEIVEPAGVIWVDKPLSSDCRYRQDLIFLAQKDLEQAQEWKTRLEVIQRHDRKLRNDNNNKK